MSKPVTYEDLGALGMELQTLSAAVVPEGPLFGLRRVVGMLGRVLAVADHGAELTLARWGRDLVLRVLMRPAWSAHHPEARRLAADLVRGLTDRASSEIAAVRSELVELLGKGEVLQLLARPNNPQDERHLAELVQLTPSDITIVLLGRALRVAVDLNTHSLEVITGLNSVRIAVGVEKLRAAGLVVEAPSPAGPLPVLALVHSLRPSSSSLAPHPSGDDEGGAPYPVPPCAA